MLARDIKPSRLQAAKQAISRVVEKLNNDKIGLIVFAGDAYVQLPITTDYSSAKFFLQSIDTDIVPVQGTAIGAAIEMALKSFTPESKTSKAIIVITDGENHQDDAIAAAKSAREQGVYVHAVGMGLAQGAPIPEPRAPGEYMKDAAGNVIISKLDEETLKAIAKAGEGLFVRRGQPHGQVPDRGTGVQRLRREIPVLPPRGDIPPAAGVHGAGAKEQVFVKD